MNQSLSLTDNECIMIVICTLVTYRYKLLAWLEYLTKYQMLMIQYASPSSGKYLPTHLQHKLQRQRPDLDGSGIEGHTLP
jgi:hypothetical protein